MKKIFKFLGALMMIVLFSMSFASCSDDGVKNPKTHDKKLVGTWNVREDYGGGDYTDITWTFKGDGKYEVKEINREDGIKETKKGSGTWETEDNEYLYLEFRMEGDRYKGGFEYEVEGKRLYIYVDGGYVEFKKK